jgi:hypothetical protein
MKKLIIFFYLIIASNFVYAFEHNPFYKEGELNIYNLASTSGAPPPPPQPDFGGGSTTPGGPDVIIGMYIPLLLVIGVYLIYRVKIKPNK